MKVNVYQFIKTVVVVTASFMFNYDIEHAWDMKYCLWGLLFFQEYFYLLGILVDFTYPSLEESVPSKPTAQMIPPVEISENTELINSQDERMGPLNISAPVEPIAASKSDVSPIIQPVPILKNIPQVCFNFVFSFNIKDIV